MGSSSRDTQQREGKMSRINNEADRIAYNKAVKAEKEAHAVLTWLRANPEIGRLNSGKFYKIVNGEQVFVKPPHEAV